MDIFGYELCLADPDLWTGATTHSGVSKYYEYILLYVNNTSCTSEYPKETLLQIDKYFPAKAGSINEPEIYLGGNVHKVQLRMVPRLGH